jgi:hypothetical protein
MPLTTDQARIIADTLLASAQTIGAYLHANKNISQEDRDKLSSQAINLLVASNFATTAAVGLALDSMADPIAYLKSTVSEANHQIKILQNVGMVIELVANLADLGVAVMDKNPGGILSALGNISRIIADIHSPPAQQSA